DVAEFENLVASDRLLVQGRGDDSNRVTAYNLDSGEQVWEADSGQMLGANVSTLLTWMAEDSETVTAIRLDDGEELFEFDIEGEALSAIGSATVYSLRIDSSVATARAISLDDGAELWEVDLDVPDGSLNDLVMEFSGDRMWVRFAGQEDGRQFATMVPFL
ncbi:MAG: PQQ-binding-like beta-propeller repeat protein, partial [Bifidobacteriaceae bacterium]|nr:PQQ-binding-like beta-propeller repeat protein [Bifidobacteriaceae bacterium]